MTLGAKNTQMKYLDSLRYKDSTELLCSLLRPLFRPRPPRLEDWRSILILKPCCIGDVLQSTALVSALRRALPQARIGYAVGPWSRAVLESNPKLDELVDAGPIVGGRPRPLAAYLRLARRLRRGRWDACFVLERSPLFSLVAWLAGIRDRIGPDERGRGVALTVRVPIRPRRQEAEACLDLARAVGVRVEEADLRTEFYVSPSDEEEVRRLLPPDVGSLVVLAPGGGINPGMALTAKRWPPERFGAVAATLASAGRTPVVIGGPQDHELAAQLAESAGVPVINLCGRLSLRGCGALLRRAELFIGNDTGVMHLAAAVGTPVVALFGPTDPAIYGPYKVPHRIIWHPQTCGPCFRLKQRPPGCSLQCIRAISVEEVEDAALELLHERV